MTSCSRIPVVRKNSNQSLSSGLQALNRASKSSFSYISGSSSTNRGQSFLPTSPRIPCAFQKGHQVLEFVVNRTWCLILHIAQEFRELKQIFALYLVHVHFRAALSEVAQREVVSRIRLSFAAEFRVFQVVRNGSA